MRRIWIVSALALLSSTVWGQAPLGSASRIQLIWAYADKRINQQIDISFDDGDYPEVIQILRIFSELHLDNYDVVTNLGWMLENIEEWEAAESVYKRYLVSNPGDADRGLALAEYYFRRKRYALVPPVLEPILAGKGDFHPNNFRDLAHSYERLKRFEDALRVWKKYTARAPGDLSGKRNLEKIQRIVDSKG
jgi:tetratricopeptide (TPR) repeat protein